MSTSLGRRALNRTLLARQHLLSRESVPTYDLVEHLVGMQAQLPLDPYVGLWSRIADFDVDEPSRLLLDRELVRIVVMRSTIHLVSARDALRIWPLTRIVLERAYRANLAKPVRGVDLDPVLAYGRKLLTERPRTRVELRTELTPRWPELDANALAYGITSLLPVVQVTPRGMWGERMRPTLTTLESWLDRPLDPAPSIDQLVLRYLRAFGPATVKDIQAWCGLTRLRAVVDRLGKQLRVLRSDDGAELYDVPDAPLVDPDVEAPVRFLPVYDNLLLAHADRCRVGGDRDLRFPLYVGSDRDYGGLLVDGFVAGVWRHDKAGLEVRTFGALTRSDRAAVVDEGHRLARFLGGGTDSDEVRLLPGTVP